MDQVIVVLILVGIVLGFSGGLYAFTNDIIGNLAEDVSCTINKVNIVPVSKTTVFLNYFISFNGVDDDIMEYGLYFLDGDGEPLKFTSVTDLEDINNVIFDITDDTKIKVQHHAELQKTLGKPVNFDDNDDYLAIGTISTTSDGQQISECSKIAEI